MSHFIKKTSKLRMNEWSSQLSVELIECNYPDLKHSSFYNWLNKSRLPSCRFLSLFTRFFNYGVNFHHKRRKNKGQGDSGTWATSLSGNPAGLQAIHYRQDMVSTDKLRGFFYPPIVWEYTWRNFTANICF